MRYFLISAAIIAACTLPTSAAEERAFPAWDGKESIADYAKRAGLEPALTVDLGGGVKWEGVLVPAGSFVMGTPPGEMKDEIAGEKQHKVTLTRPFYMGKFELTQAQYEKVMSANPSVAKGDDLPVHNVAAKDAEEFCQRMSKATGRTVRLPTEAQWEYACRAGTTTAYHSGNAIEDLDKVGWYGANSEKKPHPVGQKKPNAWGIYDMHGNIREFTGDLFTDKPSTEEATDPTGPAEGDAKNHVVRGGAFTANAAVAGNCRSASRRPTEGLSGTGFRVMVEVDK